MKESTLVALETVLKPALEQFINEKSIEELRELDWFSLNPDFYIQNKHKNKAA